MRTFVAALALVACARVPVQPQPVSGVPRDLGPAIAQSETVDAGTLVPTSTGADATLNQSCQACHSLRLVDQQRLTTAQWTATLKKMKGFGATVPEELVEPLAGQLAARRGPTSELPTPVRMDAAAAAQSFAVLDDGVFAGQDPHAGQVLFQTRCLPCHGAEARGGLGVNLVDRLMLQRAPDFAAYVRKGRGMMPPQADLSDSQLGQLLAYLRTL